MKIQLSAPDITELEIKYVNEVLRSSVLSIGPVVEQFENMIAQYIGTKHAITVNSGTSGLHLIVRSLDIKDGDEVITTPFSFVASSNCILMERAKPVFVDIDPDTFNIDIDQIESKITKRTKAIIVVDVFGQPLNMRKVNTIARQYGLKVIEDSCEALGSEFNGVKAGKLCDAGMFAFYPNKQITTAEGGVIVTDNDEVADLCRSMRSQGRAVNGMWLEHERMGYNYRLSEIHAALGVAQMERIDEILQKRNSVAALYNKKLSGISGVKSPCIAPGVNFMSWFVYVIRLDKKISRDGVMSYLRDNEIGCRAYFTPIHLQKHFRDAFGFKDGDFPVTEDVASSTIALPFFTNMSEEQVDFAVFKLKEAIEWNQR